MYTNGSLAALLPVAIVTLLVVSQDVVTVAVVLEMHACVGRDQHFGCLLFPPRHQHVCALVVTGCRYSSSYGQHRQHCNWSQAGKSTYVLMPL